MKKMDSKMCFLVGLFVVFTSGPSSSCPVSIADVMLPLTILYSIIISFDGTHYCWFDVLNIFLGSQYQNLPGWYVRMSRWCELLQWQLQNSAWSPCRTLACLLAQQKGIISLSTWSHLSFIYFLFLKAKFQLNWWF